jgi:hypothetical protein
VIIADTIRITLVRIDSVMATSCLLHGSPALKGRLLDPASNHPAGGSSDGNILKVFYWTKYTKKENNAFFAGLRQKGSLADSPEAARRRRRAGSGACIAFIRTLRYNASNGERTAETAQLP